MLSDEGLELIESNADTILEQVGIDFRDAPEARDLLRDAGAEVEEERVLPARARAAARPGDRTPHVHPGRAEPANSVEIGGNATVLAPAYGSPFVRDLEGGRRYGTIEDFRNFVKLAYASPYLHHSGGTVCEPVDLPVNKRHLDMVYAHLRYSDKPFMGSVTHPLRAEDTVEMARIVFGADFMEENTVILSLCNANSPLVWDATMLGAAKAYAEANQAVLMTPFILAGAMSPVTVAGAATQTYAEALAGMAYVQLVRPGVAVVLGSFASSLSMQSGAPTFGTPEPALVLYVMAALARRLGVPFRSGGAFTASKVPDAQAAYESANTMQPTFLAGVNFVLHAAGWLEGGLTMGYEKFVLDNDQCGMWHEFAKGVDTSENGQALDALLTNGPGSITSATSTRSRTSRPRSTDHPSRTTRASSSGRPKARPMRSARRRSGRRRSRSTRRRRSTTPSTRSCASGSSERRRPSRTRTIDGRACQRTLPVRSGELRGARPAS